MFSYAREPKPKKKNYQPGVRISYFVMLTHRSEVKLLESRVELGP